MLQEKVARGKRRVNIEKLDFTADPSGGWVDGRQALQLLCFAGSVYVSTALATGFCPNTPNCPMHCAVRFRCCRWLHVGVRK